MALGDGDIRRNVDYTLDNFTLDPAHRGLDPVSFGDALTAADWELSIEGASTLTFGIEDPDLRVLRGDLLTGWTWGKNADNRDEARWVRDGRAIDARLDDLWFRLVKVAKVRTSLTLTFEDRLVAFMRAQRGARKAYRDKMTRAEFIFALARAAGVDTFIPELHKSQPIARERQRRSEKERRDESRKGLTADDDLTVKGADAKAAQLRIMERVLDVADSLRASHKAMVALVVACIVESQFRNLAGGDRDSRGILQIRDSTQADMRRRGISVTNTDIESSVNAFLKHGFTGKGGAIALSIANPRQTAAWIAQEVQGSGPNEYPRWAHEADKIVKAYAGGGALTRDVTIEKRYAFTRDRTENSWDAALRLVEEVNWRRFAREGRLWVASEQYLFAQKPDLTLREGVDGVDQIDFEIDLGARDLVTEMTVAARAGGWTALPGMVANVQDQGPADGRWLVSLLSGSMFDTAVAATLRKPLPAKAEPAPETETVTLRGRGATGSASDHIDALYRAMESVHKAGAPYDYGGSHGAKLSNVRSGAPMDCSSSSALVLWRAGLFPGSTAITSGEFAQKWGKPGRGKFLTVWANTGHVFIELNLPGRSAKRFDTSAHGSGGSGPRLRYTSRSTAGFTPRHWPGL